MCSIQRINDVSVLLRRSDGKKKGRVQEAPMRRLRGDRDPAHHVGRTLSGMLSPGLLSELPALSGQERWKMQAIYERHICFPSSGWVLRAERPRAVPKVGESDDDHLSGYEKSGGGARTHRLKSAAWEKAVPDRAQSSSGSGKVAVYPHGRISAEKKSAQASGTAQ